MNDFYLEIISRRKPIEINNIKECNKITKEYGLTLNNNQIVSLLEKRKEILEDKGRVEFRSGIIDKIIKEFCNSPYLNKENYIITLYELIDIFYEYKNETNDLITDEELIKFMKRSFDGVCKGDLEYLSGTIMYKMKRQLLNGESIDNIKEGE